MRAEGGIVLHLRFGELESGPVPCDRRSEVADLYHNKFHAANGRRRGLAARVRSQIPGRLIRDHEREEGPLRPWTDPSRFPSQLFPIRPLSAGLLIIGFDARLPEPRDLRREIGTPDGPTARASIAGHARKPRS